jgi:hypothetical protein
LQKYNDHSLLIAGPIALSERKHIGSDASVDELNLKSPIRDRSCLPDKLIHAVFAHGAPSTSVNVNAVIGPGRGTIDADPKENGMVTRRDAQHEMKISRVKTVSNATRLIVERREFTADRPNSRHTPMVE